jgi:hypothetical protein
MSVGLIAYLLGAATVGRSTVTTDEIVKAYASGTALHLDALQAGPTGPRLADVEAAFSAVNADSNGFTAPARLTENSIGTQPGSDTPATFVGKNASARGSGLELGLGNDVPDNVRDLVLAAEAQATAPPDKLPDTHDLGPVPVSPLLYASLLHSDALAQWQNSTCLTTPQAPIAYGRGYAAKVELLEAGTDNADGSFGSPVVATNDNDPQRNAVETHSFVYAVPNGTLNHYGLVSEVHETYAPVDVLQDPITSGTIEIEVLGEWYARTFVDGIHPATMTTGVTNNDPTSPNFGKPMDPADTVIRISASGANIAAISLQDITQSSTGLEIPLNPLADIMIGEDFRAISAPDGSPDPTSLPTLTATRAAGAMDVVRAQVLQGAAGAGTRVADLRIGHFESDLQVPDGGFTCPAAATTTTTTGATTTSSTAGPTTTTTVAPTTTTTAAPTTTTTAAPTTTTTAGPTTTTSTTLASPSPTTAPPTTSTTLPTRAEAAVAVRAQPKTVG